MVVRVGRSLVEDIRRRATQLHPLALEAQVAQPRNLLLLLTFVTIVVVTVTTTTNTKVVLEEQRHPLHLAEEGPLDGQLLHLGRLRQLEGLRRRQLLRRLEVHVLPVDEHLQRARRRGGGRAAQQDRV